MNLATGFPDSFSKFKHWARQCKRPLGVGMIPADRAFYNVGDSLTVRCQTGYRPSQENIKCLNPQTTNEWDINVQCIGQCKRPDVEGMIPVDKEFYNVGESLTLQCEAGYRSLHDLSRCAYITLGLLERTTCTSRQPNDVWDNPPKCIAQCSKPSVVGIISADKEYYEVGESLPVRCRNGYRPSRQRIYCANPRSDNEWNPSLRCLGNYRQGQCEYPAGEGMIPADRQFYSAGESLTVQCDVGYRPSHEKISCINRQNDVAWDHYPRCIARCEKLANTNRYKISGLKPYYDVGESVHVWCRPGYSPLHVMITCVTLQTKDDWDNPPQCMADQCKKPNPDERYRLSVEEDYYAENEVVSVFCIEGFQPQDPEITCRRSGSTVQWDRTPQCIDSDKSLERFNLSLDLVSALWIVVPIFTMKLLALVVLLKINFNLMEEGSKRKWIFFYRKRKEDEVYENIAEDQTL
ncbi:complement factor H-like [Rhinoderma darwinii]|uniref:complement factor H-like n=1 Tax=Rhinoderma darwinii TaxID=43563 RepID=UPI003F667993